jgi:phosphate acetyltransferase
MNYSLPLDGINVKSRILFPESDDIRVLVAAITLKTMGIVDPILIGDYVTMLDVISDLKKREQYNLGDISNEDINTLK